VFFKLAFETLEEGERIRGSAGEAGKDAVLVESAHLASVRLHDRVAERDLAVAAHHDQVAAPYRADGGSAILFHWMFPSDSRVKSGVWVQ
jgi:hypothetical protein